MPHARNEPTTTLLEKEKLKLKLYLGQEPLTMNIWDSN